MTTDEQINALLDALLAGEGIEIVVRKVRVKQRRGKARGPTSTELMIGNDGPSDDRDSGRAEVSEMRDLVRPMLGIKQVLKKVPFSRATLTRKVLEGTFPKPRRIAHGRTAWFEEDVENWQKTLDEAS